MGKYDLMEEKLEWSAPCGAERSMFKLCAWNLMNYKHESAEPHECRSKGRHPVTN